MHNLPALWGPAEGEEGEENPYVYSVSLKLPGDGAAVELAQAPCGMVPAVKKVFLTPHRVPTPCTPKVFLTF